MPTVSPLAAVVVAEGQEPTAVKPPVQLPVRIWARASAGAPERVMVGLAVRATKEYQTSLLLPQALAVVVKVVAAFRLPDVLLQVVLLVNEIASAHKSFGGGSVTQILKFQLLADPEALFPFVNTRIRYVFPTVSPAPPKTVFVVKLRVPTLVPLTQAIELLFNVATVQDVVLKSCNLGASSILLPMLLKVIAGYGLCATNEYQTSSELVVPQKAFIPAVAVAVALPFLSEPEVGLHDTEEVKDMAFAQASLEG